MGKSNLLLVKSCEPTRSNLTSDRFTHALLDYLEEKEGPDGQLVLPQALEGFSHLDVVEKIVNCSGSVTIEPEEQRPSLDSAYYDEAQEADYE